MTAGAAAGSSDPLRRLVARRRLRRRTAPSGLRRTARRLRPTVEGRGDVHVGSGVVFAAGPVQSHLIVQSGAEVAIGDDVYIGHGAAISCHERITIGAGTRIGAYSAIMDTDFHVAGDTRTTPLPGPVHIGRDVHIGVDVVVLRGTSIGDGAVIEPGSVVWGAIPAGARIAGNPKLTAQRAAATGAGDVDISRATATAR
jgi:carbonic anhydrase/acetyltransferase-like protein (isoleucine patch superfamily)